MIGYFNITKKQLLTFARNRGIKPLGDCKVDKFNGVSPINEAKKNEIAFCRFEDENAKKWILESNASAIFILNSLEKNLKKNSKVLYLPCKIPRLDFSLLLKKFWIEPKSIGNTGKNPEISPNAKLGNNVKVGPFSTIGPNVKIGKRSKVGSGCHIENAEIGEDCIIGSNSVIGLPGFGYEDDDDTQEVYEFPHVGDVKIGNRVRIGALCTIDRSALGSTSIGDDTKFDDNVHVGHNTKIGKRCKITASVTISGSVLIGDDCWIAPNAVIRDWRTIKKNSIIGTGAVVVNNIEENSTVAGNPARIFPRPKNRYR